MKKIISLLLALVLCLSLCACGNNANSKKTETLINAISGEWVNVNDMDRYVFQQDGTGTHEGKTVEFTIDPESD